MRYENGLTSSVNDYVSGILARKIAKANRSREMAAAARSVRAYLEDPTTLVTPDFVIRRHIQANHPDLLPGGIPVPDLIHGPNLPWEEAVADAVATKLFKAELGLTKAAWKNYLTGKNSPKREGLFKIALGLRMDEDTTLDLMLALGEEPYNPRNPMDFVCLFCQKQPGRFGWADVQQMLKDFQDQRGKAPSAPGTGTPGMTEELTMGLEDIFDQYLGESQSKQALVDYMVENGSEFNLSGYSHTRMEGFLKLAGALAILYPVYDAAENESSTRTFQKVIREDQEVPAFRSLAKAMFQVGEWADKSWSEAEKKEKLFKLWNGYDDHMMAVDRLRNGGRFPQFFTRKDALLFISFLIQGYRMVRTEIANGHGNDSPEYILKGNCRFTKFPSPQQQLSMLEELYGVDDSFGFSYNYALRRLERVFAQPNDRESVLAGFERLTRVVDVFLTELGYQELYLPASFDRLMVLSLLSENPQEFTPLLLSGLELEETEELL